MVGETKEILIPEEVYNWMVDRYRKSLKLGSNLKILWGNRSIWKEDWIVLKKFLKEFKIKKVLEYGCGLSTELMLLEGIEVNSLESEKWWAELCRHALESRVIYYAQGQLPIIEEKFDLAFVDGPQTGPRKDEILHAKEHVDLIYFHDLDSIRRPTVYSSMKGWEIIKDYGEHFWRKKE